MRGMRRLMVVAALAALLSSADGAPDERRPYIGYVYPAGGAPGTTVRVRVGGQNLRGASGLHVTGDGVRAGEVRYLRFPDRLNSDQRRELARRLRRISAKRVAELTGVNRDRRANRRRPARGKAGQKGEKPAERPAQKPEEKPVELPDHPLLRDLDDLTLRELKKVSDYFFDPTRRLQESPQIAEGVEIEMTISPDAAPGDREIRIETPLGLTNPMIFEVGTLPEFLELEPNDFASSRQPLVAAPVVLNGQVSVRDVDRFRFRARKGQRIVIDAQARRLVPYLADAVPGWFQATLAVFDASGREVCFGDDFRFDPDPVLCFEVPESGEYVLEVRDAIDRGREDFVYRITLAERPFITRIFPLGGQEGVESTAEVAGYNLPPLEVALDTRPGGPHVRRRAFRHDDTPTNSVAFAVDDLPECREAEPDDSLRAAQSIELPRIVNGRIDRPGDVDVFCFAGRAGDQVVAEVSARRLDSPLDSVIRLTDASGKVLEWNDDHPDPGAGLVTHQADSYLLARLEADGPHYVHIGDAQGRGGAEYAYRLRVGPPQPDFQLIVTPSSLNASAGATIPVTVHALRKDGFAGDIEIALADPPAEFRLAGACIPAGRDRIRITMTVPPTRSDRPLELAMFGLAEIGGRTVSRRAVPAEDMMQAFGLRHLVPARELLVSVSKGWRRRPARVVARGPVRVPAGGSTIVKIALPGLPKTDGIELVLSEPPPGVTLGEVSHVPGGLEAVLRAAEGEVDPGFADNLIVDVYAEVVARGKEGKEKGKAEPQKRRWHVGTLPAIPILVVGGE